MGHEEQQNHQNNYATQENKQPNSIRAIKAMCHHGIIESSSADGLVWIYDSNRMDNGKKDIDLLWVFKEFNSRDNEW